MGLVLKIGAALVALLIGIWMGLPGRYTQSIEEIEEVMDRGGGRRRTVRRRFTPIAWLQRQKSVRSSQGRRRSRSRFRLESPDDR